MTAPTNLAEALDCLQAFLPVDRGISIAAYSPDSSLRGGIYVHVSSGGLSDATGEVRGTGNIRRAAGKLSDALIEAERDYAERWQRKFGAIEAAAAEFGAYCPRLAA